MIVIVLVIGGYLFSKGYLQLQKVFVGGSSASLSAKKPGRINILLLGVGGPGHDGADLTDTIVVASIDPVNNKMSLLSVPRDLWVKEPNNFMSNYGKINVAYESGKYKYLGQITDSNSNDHAIEAGFQAADRTVSDVLGIPIQYNVLLNFHAFEQGVNAVGGVTVDVPEDLVDPTMAWQNNWSPILAKKGTQHMNGYHALLYARSRETSSDFARSERQRAILVALKDKVFSAGTLSNPIKVSNLLSTLGDNVRTDISMADIEQLRQIVGNISASNIKSIDLDKPPNDFITTGAFEGQSIVRPKLGMFDYSQIRDYARKMLRDGYLVKENAKVSVLNGTATAGLATERSDEFKSLGYHMAAPADAPAGDYQKTVLVDLTDGKKPHSRDDLEKHLGVKASTNLPTGIKRGQADFVIILGQDEASS